MLLNRPLIIPVILMSHQIIKEAYFRNAWASLGNLKRHEAMQEFITDVVKLMPHLRAYFESLKKEKEDEEKRL